MVKRCRVINPKATVYYDFLPVINKTCNARLKFNMGSMNNPQFSRALKSNRALLEADNPYGPGSSKWFVARQPIMARRLFITQNCGYSIFIAVFR